MHCHASQQILSMIFGYFWCISSQVKPFIDMRREWQLSVKSWRMGQRRSRGCWHEVPKLGCPLQRQSRQTREAEVQPTAMTDRADPNPKILQGHNEYVIDWWQYEVIACYSTSLDEDLPCATVLWEVHSGMELKLIVNQSWHMAPLDATAQQFIFNN